MMTKWFVRGICQLQHHYFEQKDGKGFQQYQPYYFTIKEFIRVAAYAVLKTILLAVLFYNSVVGIILLMPLSVIFINEYQIRQMVQRQSQLAYQFKDCVYALSAALSVGYSLENAFSEAMHDMKIMHQDSIIVEELSLIINQLKVNMTIEQGLHDLGKRSGIEDINQLADIIQIAKKTGGNIVDIMKKTAEIIGLKIEVRREIETIIAAKKFEHKIMSVMPCGMIIYLRITSPGFLDVMYETGIGVVMMTFCLMIYYLAIWVSRKIIEIEV